MGHARVQTNKLVVNMAGLLLHRGQQAPNHAQMENKQLYTDIGCGMHEVEPE